MKRLLPQSIRVMLVLVVLAATAPILAMVLFIGREMREEGVREARADAMRLAASFAERQESIVFSARQTLAILAAMPCVQQFDQVQVTHLFQDLLRNNPVHSNYVLMRPNGDVFAAALPFANVNLSDTLHVSGVMATRKFTAGEYRVGRIVPGPFIAFAGPVFDAHGGFIGIVSVAITLGRYKELFDDAKLAPGSFLGIVDGKGVRLVHYPEKPLTNPIGERISPQAFEAYFGSQHDEGYADFVPNDGVLRHFAFRRLRLEPSEPPYLLIGIGIPESYIQGRANHEVRRYLLWVAAAASFALLLAWLVARHGIIGRLRRFALLARRVGEGDLDAVTGMDATSGTLGVVAGAFDEMVKALKEREVARAEAEEAMAAALREKDVLLREIHHRVKNNLQIISSLLSLQEQSSSSEEARRILRDSQGRVTSMALIHDQLYRSSDLSSVDAAGYLEALLRGGRQAWAGACAVDILTDVPKMSLELEHAIPFGLIMNELLTNAYKHAFKGRERGTIRVEAAVRDGSAHFSVSDDGAGLAEGFGLEKLTSLGLQIVSMLAEQLHGSLSFMSGEGGTVFRFSVPVRRGA